MNDILWKEIPGFSGYEASTDGRIRNKKTLRDISLRLLKLKKIMVL